MTVIAFIRLLGFGKEMGDTMKTAARTMDAIRMSGCSVKKLMDKTKMVAAEAGSPRNTCLFFNG